LPAIDILYTKGVKAAIHGQRGKLDQYEEDTTSPRHSLRAHQAMSVRE